MGCWNKTCGLTRLPIHEGDAVLVVPIVANNRLTDRCYSHALWAPSSLSFWSKYNDYGGGEEPSGSFLDHCITAIRDALVEVAQGENKYHDIPVTKEAFDVELFFSAVHEGRAAIHTYYQPEPSVLDFVMIRKDVLDDFTKRLTFSNYVGENKGNGGWGNSYFNYTWKDLIEYIPQYIAYLRDNIETLKKYRGFFGNGCRTNIEDATSPVYLVNSFVEPSRDIMSYANFGDARSIIIDAISSGCDDSVIYEMITDRLYHSLVCFLYGTTRNIWVPGCHEGSQDDNHEAQRMQAEVIIAMADKHKKKWDNDE